MHDSDADDAIPWPTPDADLLAQDGDWWLVACVDWPRDRWIGYVTGYWRAAELIVTHVAGTGRDQDRLAYPFLMCWRHYVELQLKVLIIFLHAWHRGAGQLPKTHRIDLLWQTTRPLLERAFPDEDKAAIADTQRVLMQLNDLDPSSEHFRYPVLKDGSATLAGVRHVHIRRFHDAMAGVAHFLDAAESAIRVMLDERAEHEAAMASYYGVDGEY